MITTKRIYASFSKKDGFRILVDRLWPRGVSKEKAKINLWVKDIGPSNDLRKWFGHDEKKWPEFRKKYRKELKEKSDLLSQIREMEKRHKKVTLLFGARDEKRNQAVVIAEILKHSS